jgi:hypothetical protein
MEFHKIILALFAQDTVHAHRQMFAHAPVDTPVITVQSLSVMVLLLITLLCVQTMVHALLQTHANAHHHILEQTALSLSAAEFHKTILLLFAQDMVVVLPQINVIVTQTIPDSHVSFQSVTVLTALIHQSAQEMVVAYHQMFVRAIRDIQVLSVQHQYATV